MKTTKQWLSSLLFLAALATSANGGTYAVTGITIAADLCTTGSTATTVNDWLYLTGSAPACDLHGPYTVGTNTQAAARVQWTVVFTPSYPGELPPTSAHCNVQLKGKYNCWCLIQGPSTNWNAHLESVVDSYYPNSGTAVATLAPGQYQATGSAGNGPSLNDLPDIGVNTGGFSLVGGVWTAIAEGTYASTATCTAAASGPAYNIFATATASFEVHARIHEIEGQAV